MYKSCMAKPIKTKWGPARQKRGGPGWVGKLYFRETDCFLTEEDIAGFMGVHVGRVRATVKTLGVQYRIRDANSDPILLEPFTDEETKAILAIIRIEQGLKP